MPRMTSAGHLFALLLHLSVKHPVNNPGTVYRSVFSFISLGLPQRSFRPSTLSFARAENLHRGVINQIDASGFLNAHLLQSDTDPGRGEPQLLAL